MVKVRCKGRTCGTHGHDCRFLQEKRHSSLSFCHLYFCSLMVESDGAGKLYNVRCPSCFAEERGRQKKEVKEEGKDA